MVPLPESEKSEIIRLLSTGPPLPEQWREDYTSFFEQVRNASYAGWRSGLMQELDA